MQTDGCFYAAAINATCLALLDASIPMNGIFCAVTIILAQNDQLKLDPNSAEQMAAKATFTFVLKRADDLGITGCYSTGNFTVTQLKSAMALAKSGASHICEFFKSSVAKKFIIEESN